MMPRSGRPEEMLERAQMVLTPGKLFIGKLLVTARLTCPQIVEIIGHSGVFDYIELCGEYSE